jgi:predicted DNA-binding transcriptional regulator AlpA
MLQQIQSIRIKDKQVAAILGCCRSAVWNWAKTRPGFPQPRREGLRYTYWLRHEVESYALNGSKTELGGKNG